VVVGFGDWGMGDNEFFLGEMGGWGY
jgi:hypothetical protein